ncbi:hypothetical protein LBW89_19450 [Paenibacillus sp. alder61]|uniref:hypothetical protein n=1 Tax=Paenibacillus sp. alder61 TaxID=2862948 RepID=UPI001CD344DD|nr:hypothetical protein [Paenibacillus sp. alder61]MCA1295191.1 hypothetical protein [Paenibacillus sp. alder61]
MAKAYLQITLRINAPERDAATKVYTTYKEPFLTGIPGAVSKELLVRDEDVQVLHGFNNEADAIAYLESDLFTNDVVVGLKNLLQAEPEIRIYNTF